MSKLTFSAPPVLIIGLPRSGTSLVSELLGSHPHVALLVEPHALWKCGDYGSLDDGDRAPSEGVRDWIRSRMVQFASGRMLVEKSPVNCLRPNRVYSVFPEARIIYIERDPAACVFSNLKRSEQRDAFKLSTVLKKYAGQTGNQELPNARSYFPIWKQLRMRDWPHFVFYFLRMLGLRRKGVLPFGPRLAGFNRSGAPYDWEDYHYEVWEGAQKAKASFSSLYADRFHVVHLEALAASPEVTREMFTHAGLQVNDEFIEQLYSRVDRERIYQNLVPEKLAKRFNKGSNY